MPRFHTGHLALLLTAALFGIAFIFQRHSATAVSALTFMSWRLPVSAAFLLAILALCRRPVWGHWLRDGICCGILLFLGMYSQQWGLEHTTAGKSGFITSLYVILVPLLALLGGERLGRTLTEYRERYFRPGQQSGYVVYSYDLRPGADKEIFRKIGDICVSMKSEDYLTLPPLMQNIVKVQLPDKALERYREMEKELVLSIGDTDITAVSAAALTSKLLQMANGAVYDTEGDVVRIHDAKLEALDEIISCNEGKSVMVIYSYRHDLERLREKYPKARELKTAEDIRDWNAGRIPLLLVHPQSAGHGLNLQHGGHIVVWYGLTWSLEAYQQTNKRLHRPGQTEPVMLHHLVAKGTIDEDVMRALEGKAAGQESMLDAVKARIERYKAR